MKEHIKEQILRLNKEKQLFDKMTKHNQSDYRRDVNNLLDEIKMLKSDQYFKFISLRKKVDAEELSILTKLQDEAGDLLIPYSEQYAKRLEKIASERFIKRHSHGRWSRDD